METMEMNPRLRVMPVPVEIKGKQMLLFQDPDRITDETILMPVEAAVIIQFFDGNHSVRQIQEELMRASGQLIDSDLIKGMVDELDQHLLLESPRFLAHMRKLSEEWMAQPARPTCQAGQAYPGTPDKLTAFIDAFYTSPEGPGELPGTPRANDLKGIIAPHMDMRVSGAVTAHAFKALAEQTEAGLFVIFGTGHNEPHRLFVPSDKDYQTPLGALKTDRELVHDIARLRNNRNPMNDYLHKQEHSIEFMAVFLRHATAGRENIRIVPVLTSGLNPSLISKTPPEKDPEFQDFMAALKQAIKRRGEQVCFIAGADLAHLGPRYGDKETWAPIRMAEEQELDRKMLSPLQVGDKNGFFQEIAGIGDRRRICGLPPIYAAMEASGAKKAAPLKWSYWHETESHSVVTFTSMALY